jgi:hypothetical protein
MCTATLLNIWGDVSTRGSGSEKAHPFLIKEIQFDAEKVTTVLPPMSVCACAIRVVPKK